MGTEWNTRRSAVPQGAHLSAGIQFPPGFRERVTALRVSLGAARRSREGAGRAQLAGSGADLMGYRPYSPGEDLRQLDWNLLARLDKPFVKVTRREAGELWVVVLDASASMGVGPPSKLQRAAECCVGLWGLGAMHGAQMRLVMNAPGAATPLTLDSPAPRDLDAPLAFLEQRTSGGDRGLRSSLAMGGLFREATRVICLGDLCDDPLRELLALRRRVKDLHVMQVLSPHELDPPLGDVELVDLESGERLKRTVDEAARLAYQVQLEKRLDTWRSLAGKHRFGFHVRSSAVPFEDMMRDLARG